ncbi:MAG: flagellar assembly peptidoglycan hydrolase FlgJ [Burkholderiales bacterium]
MSTPSLPPAMALDARGLDTLRYRAKTDPEAALKDAAKQFEVLFMNMLMKSMREATPGDGMFDSEQTRFYTAMLDQQLSEKLAGRGMGLAEIMVRQLRQQGPPMPAAEKPEAVAPATARPAMPGTDAVAVPPNVVKPAPAGDARAFVNNMWPHAAQASRDTGIPAHFIIGQAALESGWGAREIRGANGQPSHNLFGIKAGRGWTGRTVDVTTTEYIGGVPQKVVDRFRAYDSYGESFRDYARLLKTNTRYAGVIEGSRDAASFARNLQQAGYATDPQYAEKLTRVINSNVLRHSLLS